MFSELLKLLQWFFVLCMCASIVLLHNSCVCSRTAMVILNLGRLHQVAAAADRPAIQSLAADHLPIRKRVPDHCLARLVAMAASTRAVQDILIPDHVPGPVHIPGIADVVIAATLEVLVQGAADM